MIVNLARRDGDTVTLEPIDEGVMFEGGQAQQGVLVTFTRQGQGASGRVIDVAPPSSADLPESEMIVTIEQIDDAAVDTGSERALSNLPPAGVFDTKEERDFSWNGREPETDDTTR